MTRSSYLVLDMINDLIHEDGPNGNGPYGRQARERGIVGSTRKAIEKARSAQVPVGFVRIGFSDDYKECPATSRIFSKIRGTGIFRLGAWGTEIHPDLQPLPGDLDIVKHRVSPFHGTDLEVVLRTMGVTRLYVSGVSTNAVVQAAVREGHDRDFDCIVLADCCAATSAEEHEAALGTMARFAGMATSDTVTFSD